MRSRFWIAIFFCAFGLIYGDEVYEVRLDGMPSRETGKLFRSVSETVNRKNQAPPSLNALKKRAEGDIPLLIKVLQSQGYYEATAQVAVKLRGEKQRVTFVVRAGPVYVLSKFRVASAREWVGFTAPLEQVWRVPDPLFDESTICPQDLGLELGTAVIAAEVKRAERKLAYRLKEEAYPFSSIVKSDILADRKSRSISLTFYINTGPLLKFGDAEVFGLSTVDSSLVYRKIAWDKGSAFHPQLIEDTRDDLEQSRLFQSIEITYAEEPRAGNLLPMFISIEETKHRSIGLGVTFTTSRGPGGIAEWEHRNLSGLGRRLQVKADVRQRQQAFDVRFRLPDLWAQRQDLIISSRLEHESADAFDENFLELSALIERRFNPHLWLSYGVNVKHLIISRSDANETHTLFNLPATLRWSTADDLLNPTSGINFQLQLQPTLSLPESDLTYIKGQLSISAYQPLDKLRKWVIAGKLTTGSIAGSSRIRIPPPERFYAGGESLLRGYDYLTVSPLDGNLKPLGGRSLLVAAAEIRWRATDTISLVSFFDAGNVYGQPLPELQRKILTAYGFGLRYHTSIAPIRLDLAFPINRRRGVDRALQVYVSIGQAF